ncbi:MAG: HAD-IC family P-type ATPase [Myxococcaceae bacterium]|jgi:Ca2+-transporting ATPase|nr:HAD-IC family P-type ATPase [Myxococcaceae bacterium]
MAWHAVPVEEVLAKVASTEAGLSDAEASKRLAADGPNRLTARSGASWVKKLLEQFLQPLVVVLIGAGVLSAVLGDFVDAAVIGAVVVANALLGFFQEHRAEQAISSLGQTLVTEATVVREGKARRVPSADLVVGDVVALQSGDTVPADLRLISAKDLEAEEAALTGESVPSEKSLALLPENTVLGDRKNLAFAGSAITWGQARGVVVATGDRTEAGRIATLMANTVALETPLTRRIAQLSKLLVWVILGVAAALFLLGVVRGQPAADTFNAAVALAVGAIPEGLPAAVTIVLAFGVSAMAKRRALIRRLPAVETLGSTTVICSDKTGTLTQNQMTVTTLVTASHTHQVTGVGFEASGHVERDGVAIAPAPETPVFEALLGAGLCCDTRLVWGTDGVKVEGDPTEAALLVAAGKIGLTAERLARDFPRVDVVPFESEHMYMATLNRDAQGRVTAWVKGSSDALLAKCVEALRDDGSAGAFDAAAVHAQVDALASRGLRVLVLARRRMPEQHVDLTHADVTQLTFVALVGMVDPPRPEAKDAVAKCRAAGIQVKMITGDHAVTAAAIADELGLEGARAETGRLKAVTGAELSTIPEAEWPALAEQVAVFARVAPEQKLQLVRALQTKGHVVAMTGDGVNDAPALKQADIGVAMGKNGTDVARGAAAMILTDDNFATIQAAVEEGRGVYDNLVKFIAWTLPTNGGAGVVLLLAMLLATDLPVLPVQLLWVNMVAAVLLGLTLVFEPREPGLMTRPPRPVNSPILDRALIIRTALVSAAMGAAAFGLFGLAERDGLTLAQARTIAVNTIVIVDVGYLFACRSLRLPMWRIGFFSNWWVWGGALAMLLVQLTFTELDLMNRLFHTEPLPLTWWLIPCVVGLAVYVLAEAKKVLTRAS